MNQTRILLGVVLLLAVALGYMWWSQQNTQEQLMAAVQRGQGGAPAEAAAAAAPAANPAGGAETVAPAAGPEAAPVAGSAPAVPAAAKEEDERMAAMKEEMAAMKAEMENLKVKGEVDAEEKQRLAAELERAKFEIDLRLQRIRSAPMLTRVTKALPEHGFVVIGAGRSSGLEPGDEFSIRRADKIISRIRIGQSIEETECVAEHVPGTMVQGESINEGDEVVKLD